MTKRADPFINEMSFEEAREFVKQRPGEGNRAYRKRLTGFDLDKIKLNEASKKAIDEQKPWYDSGVNALGRINEGMQPGGQFVKPLSVADYEQDPYNEFLTQQGGKAIERSASASGLRGSGNVLASLTDYGQDMAKSGFNDWYNRETASRDNEYNKLAGLSGTGMIAGTQMGSTDINNTQFQSGQTFKERMDGIRVDGQIRAAREANRSNPLMDILGAGAMGVGIYSGLRK